MCDLGDCFPALITSACCCAGQVLQEACAEMELGEQEDDGGKGRGRLPVNEKI